MIFVKIKQNQYFDTNHKKKFALKNGIIYHFAIFDCRD